MKKFISIILSAAILLSVTTLFACDPEDTPAETSGEAITTSPETEAETETQTETETETESDTCTETNNDIIVEPKKPVIYLYPQKPTDVSVKLDFNGNLTFTYPKYNDGWQVRALPDGTLFDENGNEYSYLFWEGVSNVEYDMSEGFVIKGEDTAAFLRETLAKMGLTPREYNEFIVYWLPLMQNNPYNLITFQGEAYTDNAVLEINPAPDSILRVFMAFKSLEEPIEIKEPEIVPFERKGFCVVEWGGCELK